MIDIEKKWLKIMFFICNMLQMFCSLKIWNIENSKKISGFDLIWSRKQAQLVDALAVGGEEGRGILRKA
jgi:hypothetical protein